MAVNLKQRKVANLEILELPGDLGGALIICLHGFGADAYNLVSLSETTSKLRPRPTWIFPQGPMAIPFGPDYIGRAWFEINFAALQLAIARDDPEFSEVFPQSIEPICSQINQLIWELSSTHSKIFIGGFSQGSMVALQAALSSSQNIQGVFILSGTLFNPPLLEKLAPKKKGMAFFQSHGDQDEVLPYFQAQALSTFLIKMGLQGSLLSFHGGHEIPSSVQEALTLFLTQ